MAKTQMDIGWAVQQSPPETAWGPHLAQADGGSDGVRETGLTQPLAQPLPDRN